MLFKGSLGCILIIFTANSQNQASFFQFLQPTLQVEEGRAATQFSQLDTFQSVITDDTAPKGIVQIQHNTFFDHALSRADNIDHLLGHNGQCIQRQHSLCNHLHLAVMGKLSSESGLNDIQIQNADRFYIGSSLCQQVVQFPNLIQERSLDQRGAVSKNSIGHLNKIRLQNSGSRHFLMEAIPAGLNIAQLLLSEQLSFILRAKAESVPHPLRGKVEQQHIRLELIGFRFRIHQLGINLIIIRIHHRNGHARHCAIATDRSGQILG